MVSRCDEFDAEAADSCSSPPENCVHHLFEQQVARTPDHIAVVYGPDSLTYAQLNTRANQLARYLIRSGVRPDQLVGVCLERSLAMAIALLGVLKAGGAYVPIDPGYPAQRLSYMLRDAAPGVLLTQEALRDGLPAGAARIFALDTGWSEIGAQDTDNPDARVLRLYPDHLAYVIYTSGSTGQPKGAMNPHRGVVNRLQWMQHRYRLTEQDRVLQKTPFSFDVSVWEFFWTLMSGARLIVARPRGHQDPAYLTQLIEATGVTTLHFVPSMLQTFLDEHREGSCSSLRHVVCSGEELTPVLQNRCLERLPGAALSNLYGPTEAAVDVTSWECSRSEGSRVPIGRPISNLRMHVLDDHYEPVPVGVAGDLYIEGVGVGRGYWDRPDLTAERFIASPCGTAGERMYRTGDLARYRADGELEYLGRVDHQVKLRGFRIELGEIEAALCAHPRVAYAVVLLREYAAADARLVAFVVTHAKQSSRSHNALVNELRAYLKECLPSYMLPSAIVPLERLPVTPNGKLDRGALPFPQQPQRSDLTV
jgi:amino acid adenylation domain-containing protein